MSGFNCYEYLSFLLLPYSEELPRHQGSQSCRPSRVGSQPRIWELRQPQWCYSYGDLTFWWTCEATIIHRCFKPKFQHTNSFNWPPLISYQVNWTECKKINAIRFWWSLFKNSWLVSLMMPLCSEEKFDTGKPSWPPDPGWCPADVSAWYRFVLQEIWEDS